MVELTGKRIFPKALESFSVNALVQAGMREKDAAVAAEVFVATDTWGIHTHGTYNLINYVRKIRAGGIDPQATPEVVAKGPCWAIVDGNSAIAMVTSVKAMELAITEAATMGIGFAGVKNSNSFGAAAYYANMAVKHDMIGLVLTNVGLSMTAPGSRGCVIGNNTLAYAVPAGEERPIFLDIATSVVAGTKVGVAKKLGQPIPNTWMVDERGVPTSDASKYPLAASLLPMAGHKGYGLAVMLEVLAGVLTGAGVTTEVASWGVDLPARPKTGHAFVAINVDAIIPIQRFKERMDKMIRGIKESPKADGEKRIYLPGEMEWEKYDDALKYGILLPPETVENLSCLAEEMGIELTGLFQ